MKADGDRRLWPKATTPFALVAPRPRRRVARASCPQITYALQPVVIL